MKMKSKSPLVSQILSYCAIALIAAPICVAAFNPRIPIWFAILFGAAIGCPVLVVSFRLHRDSQPAQRAGDGTSQLIASRQFWPTQAERWGMIALLTYAATLIAPFLLFLPMFTLIPEGDTWPIVTVRVLLATIAMGATYWWLGFAKRTFPRFFRGKLSDEVIDAQMNSEARKEPASAMAAVRQYSPLLVYAAFAFFVTFSVLIVNNPVPLNEGPRRVRGLIRILMWCRGNPNTVVSSSVLIGIGSLAIYAYQIVRAHARGNQADRQS